MILVLLSILMEMLIVTSLVLKKKIKTGNDGIKNVETLVILRQLFNLWRILKIPLINLILTLSANCVISVRTATIQATKFTITNVKLYV